MTLEEIEKRVQTLEDIEAIKRLKAKYVQACDDNYNPEKLGKLFTEDGTWDGGEVWGAHHGRSEIKRFFSSVSSDIIFSVHYALVPEIYVEGTKAHGRWYGLVPATKRGNKAIWMSVFYDDEYEKVKGDWLIANSKVSVFFLVPYKDGWGKKRLAD